MPKSKTGASLAVLIDADNASAAHARAIFEEVATLGEANVRRIYGDFAAERLKGWRKVIQPLAILPQQQFNYTKGKNAADIALVIDAMDLMHRGDLDGFCLVSSDSDFTRLAQRLREDGAAVYGFGAKKTPEAFRNACTRFIYVENLIEAAKMRRRNKARVRSRGKNRPQRPFRLSGRRWSKPGMTRIGWTSPSSAIVSIIWHRTLIRGPTAAITLLRWSKRRGSSRLKGRAAVAFA